MKTISRREVLESAALTAICAAGRQLRANPLGLPIGCQTWPVRDSIAKDFPGTLRELKGAGFQAIEMCSPGGYSDSGFGPLAKYKGSELKRIITDAGLTCESSHFGIQELRKSLPQRIEWAKDLGLKQMIVPSLDGPAKPTMDDVKRAAEEYNRMAEQTARAGMQQGLHNEEFEMTEVGGKRTYDLLFDLLDAKLVKMQFQVSNISRGYDAADYFTRYPGRFLSMHAQGWSGETKQIVAIGQGTLDWKRIFRAAKTGGIRNYFVEMDLPKMRASVPYLRSLNV